MDKRKYFWLLGSCSALILAGCQPLPEECNGIKESWICQEILSTGELPEDSQDESPETNLDEYTLTQRAAELMSQKEEMFGDMWDSPADTEEITEQIEEINADILELKDEINAQTGRKNTALEKIVLERKHPNGVVFYLHNGRIADAPVTSEQKRVYYKADNLMAKVGNIRTDEVNGGYSFYIDLAGNLYSETDRTYSFDKVAYVDDNGVLVYARDNSKAPDEFSNFDEKLSKVAKSVAKENEEKFPEIEKVEYPYYKRSEEATWGTSEGVWEEE